jgi:predicted MFS family arabinose efflux permease
MARVEIDSRNADAVATALGGAIALAAALGIGRFVYTPILPPMVAALGLSRAAAGLLASANFLGYLIGALAAATPRLPFSRQLWLIAALLLSAVTTGAMGLTESWASFLVLRLTGGIASAFVLILASSVVLEHLAASRRPGLSALHFAGVGIGIAASAALVAVLRGAGDSWSTLWIGNGVLSLVAALAAALLLRPRNPAPRASGDLPEEATHGGSLARLIIAYGLFGFGYVITATFLVAIVRSTPVIRPLEPVIWVVFGLAAAPSILLWRHVASLLGTPASFAMACVIEAIGVAASVAWPSAAGIFLASILVGGTFVGVTALGLMRAHVLAGRAPQRAIALMTGAFGLGQIIGPSFAGILSDQFGSFALPSFVAAFALLAAAALAGW